MELKITKYEKNYEAKWDSFVESEAVNGTFLQQWRFLNYHAEGRFEDSSIMFWCKEKLVAVCPACTIMEEGKKIFYSHMGSTYGGLLISKDMLRVEKMKVLMECFEDYLKGQNFHKCVLKPTMNLLCVNSQDILEFFMYRWGYHESKELNIYIDYAKYDKVNILNNFSKMKKRNTKKCMQEGLELKKLGTYKELEDFWTILAKNLTKYHKKPIHTVSELMDIQKRLGKDVEFYGAYWGDKLLSGTMVFLFDKTKCAHTQYLAADTEFSYLNPMTFIYYKMVKIFADREFNFLSWGIATEHLGSEINYSLANNKEEFGSVHSINYIYEKEF